MSAAAPASQGRAKRETKQVERMTIEVKEKDPEDFKIKAGAGKKLGDIENIVFKISKHNAASEELKQLHRACFGRAGSKNEIKKNLREFSGFVCADMAAEKAKKVALIGKLDLKQVKSMLDTCDCPLTGTKAECVERLVDFLEKPDESGKKSLVEKAGEKRKRAEKKKEKVTKKATKGKARRHAATHTAAPRGRPAAAPCGAVSLTCARAAAAGRARPPRRLRPSRSAPRRRTSCTATRGERR